MNNKKAIVVGLGLLVVFGVSTVYYFFQSRADRPASVVVDIPASVPAPINIPEPAKTDFVNKAPIDFPANIPVEQGAKITQGYSLDYPGQKQLTMVFSSTKTMKENYTLYADFLRQDGWTVSNKYESATVSSLYGKKENNEINITINTGASAPAQSQVIISVLNK